MRKAFESHDRAVERALRKDRPKLFRALEEFAMIEGDADSWKHFRRRRPDFFPEDEYNKVTGLMPELRKSEELASILTIAFPDSDKCPDDDSSPSIRSYSYWLNQVWRGGETDPYLEIMLGVRPTPMAKDLCPEDVHQASIRSIKAYDFALDWTTGRIRYRGMCDFQRALYLLFRESWRARVCERCDACFIAKREAQKYCSTDCSEEIQREVKRKWWAERGKALREKRSKAKSKKKGSKDGTQKTR
jgi:hypothetical protein